MEKNYLSKSQQERLVRERPGKKYFVLYDGSVASENPYTGNTQEAYNCIEERKRFLREISGL